MPGDVLCNLDRRCGRAGFSGDVRRHGDVGVMPKRMLRWKRFYPEYVEGRVPNLTAVQRSKECLIVDERATTRIDNASTFGEQREGSGVQYVFSGCGVRQ